jgi:hypothetical protein
MEQTNETSVLIRTRQLETPYSSKMTTIVGKEVGPVGLGLLGMCILERVTIFISKVFSTRSFHTDLFSLLLFRFYLASRCMP